MAFFCRRPGNLTALQELTLQQKTNEVTAMGPNHPQVGAVDFSFSSSFGTQVLNLVASGEEQRQGRAAPDVHSSTEGIGSLFFLHCLFPCSLMQRQRAFPLAEGPPKAHV